MSSIFKDSIGITGIASCFPNNSNTFKQLQVEMILEIPSEKPDMEHILHDNIKVEICSTHIIQTPCSKSFEGQVLTGNKLIVNGRILQKIEYVADNCTQSVHAAELSKDFSTFICLDCSTCHFPTYKVIPYIEDVFIKQLDSRKIFKNVMLLLDAAPVNTELLHHSFNEYSLPCENVIEFQDSDDCTCFLSTKKYFSQICCEETIMLPKNKPDIEQIVSIIVEPEIISMKFINTIKGKSNEGQQLTGKKAVLEIKLKQKVLYAADTPDQSVFGAESIFYKSAYIVLPKLIEGTDPDILYKYNMLKPKITIEDVYYEKLDKKKIFKNICMLIELEFIPTFEICYSSHNNCTRSNLLICYEDGSSAIPITHNKKSKSIKPCWSPNGSQIAYLSWRHDGYSLFSFNIRDCIHRPLVSHDSFDNISSFSWLKDNNQIIFSAVKNDSKELYLLNTASSKYQQLTNGSGLTKSYYPKISPDGCQVAYLRSTSYLVNLWCSDTLGKNPCKITTTGTVRDYDWLSNSNGFVYIDNSNKNCCEIYMIKLQDMHPSCIIKSSSLYGCKSLVVSPDGCYIAFVGTNKCSDDIYIYDLCLEKLRNITNHRSSVKISSIVWKIDSSKIYYAAKEYMYYDIYSVDVAARHKEHLTNTSSSYMQLSYRPRIK